MKDRNLNEYLYQSLEVNVVPDRMDETINMCKELMQKQSITLFIVCLSISTIADIPQYIPVFIPLFVLAVMPVLFRSQFYGMNEIEAVTRASSAQIMFVKLILAGAANLVCMTVVLALEIYLQNSTNGLGQMILYTLVPYLICMVTMLRLIRLRKKENIQICMVIMLSSCVGWGISAKMLPWLYETSAIGIWMISFVLFSVFFIKEIGFIVEMRKEGKMYGIIA